MTTKLTTKTSSAPRSSQTSFRHRYGGGPPGPPVIDDAPERVRAGFVHLFWEFEVDVVSAAPGGWNGVYRRMEKALRLTPNYLIIDARQAIHGHLLTCGWFPFYESVEFFAELITGKSAKSRSAKFREEINQIFREENVGYRVDNDGHAVVASTPEFQAAGRSALEATDRPGLRHLNVQLRNAFEQLALRRLNPANAVKDGVGALQGVVRVQLSKPRGKVSVAELKGWAGLHPALAGSIDALLKIEGFRGDMAGHDAKAEREVTAEEAILVLHQCSAAITYLASTPPSENDTGPPSESPVAR